MKDGWFYKIFLSEHTQTLKYNNKNFIYWSKEIFSDSRNCRDLRFEPNSNIKVLVKVFSIKKYLRNAL